MDRRQSRERLRGAQEALQEGRFEEAFRYCESAAGLDPTGETRRLCLGAYALFGLGHIHQAQEWVTLYLALRRDAIGLYMQAFLDVHARRFDEALLHWTTILQEHPSETLADRLIERLRSGEEAVFVAAREPNSFAFFLPTEPLAEGPLRRELVTPRRRGQWRLVLRPRMALLLIGAMLLVGLGAGIVGSRPGWLPLWSEPDPYSRLADRLPGPPEGGSVEPLPNVPGDAPAQPGTRYASRDEVAVDLRRARRLIAAGHPNQARHLLGRVEISNASFELKERARLLRDMIPKVPRRDFRDPIDVALVVREPFAYRGADVLWAGSVRRVHVREGRTHLDLRLARGTPVQVACPPDLRLPENLGPKVSVQVYGTFVDITPSGVVRLDAREIRPLASAED